MKMFDRPPLLEEPFAQTLLGKMREIKVQKELYYVTEVKLKGGLYGLEGTDTRTLELGGNGDCGWRAIAYQLVRLNLKGQTPSEDTMKKIPGLVKALKAQAIFYLTNTNTSWQSGWAVDNTWTNESEGGKPAANIKEFIDVLS